MKRILHKLALGAILLFGISHASAQNYTGIPFSGTAISTSSTIGADVKIEFEDFDSGVVTGDGGVNADPAGALAASKPGSYRDTTVGNSGDNITYRTGTDVDLRNNGTGVAITGIAGNEWAAYTVNFAETGDYHMNLNYAHGAAGGKRAYIYIFELDDFDATPLLTVQLYEGADILPSTGNSSTFADSADTDSFTLDAGTYVVVIQFRDSGPNYDYFNITYEAATPVSTIYETTGAGASGTTTGSFKWNDSATWKVKGSSPEVNGIPTIDDDVEINHKIEIGRNATGALAKSITCSNPGQLYFRENTSLTVTDDIVLNRSNDAITFYAQTASAGFKTATMIFGGTYTAGDKTVIRKRLSSDKWHLISSPFNNARVDFTTESSNTYLMDNGTVLSLASYDDSNAPGSKYVYYTNVTPLGSGPRFGNGQGYSISASHASTPDYYMTGDQHSGPVSYTLSTGGNGFNLIGNPYISYLHANDAAHATNNILRVNGANGSNILTEDTIWLWDGDAGSWVTKNLGDASFRIAPLQGFFVKASSASAFSFTKSMESHVETDAFLKSSNNGNFEIDLSIESGNKSISTSIRYKDGMTTSFDNGYDSSMFGGYASTLELYSVLLESNPGKKLAIQSLPNSDYDNTIIPIGVTAAENSEIIFSAEVLNLPSGYEVYLEDSANNSFTRLDVAGSEYTTTVTETSTEGRFYLHTTTSTLSIDSQLLNRISIYKSNTSTLKIVGLSKGKVSFKLYDLLGKQLLNSNFIAENGVKEITLPNLSNGVYVVQLETENGKLNKKVVLD